jgi:GNAT superfamily N-acetyltransferase
MTAARHPAAPTLPDGYVLEVDRRGPVVAARVRSATGAQAASGHAAETCDAFVYDRIVTAPEHRRRGLATAVMAALHGARQREAAPQFLVATEAGRALYAALGWRTLSLYATASTDQA